MTESTGRPWREIATSFLKIGATAYGGPAIMGVMQAEFQERRQWVSKTRFVEGLALVNVLPGATATQLGIFLGYARAGWWGGLLAGVCFAAPGFVVMLALALLYATLGVKPILRGALYGLGPVVLGVFIVALLRLGRSALRALAHRLVAVAAALAALLSPLGTVAILLLAGAVGVALSRSRRAGAVLLLVLVVLLTLAPMVTWSPRADWTATTAAEPSVARLSGIFAAIGAFTFGGGLSMIALIEENVVERLQWLTAQEFVAGLALGQLTPGPILMVAAYVGYKLLGVSGAVAAAAAAFLPSFLLMLVILPAFDRIGRLSWMKAVMQGIGPAVIGVMSVALARMAPAAAPDPVSVVLMAGTVAALLLWRVGAFTVIGGGAVVGIVRSRLCEWPGVRAPLCLGSWGRS